MPKSRRRKLPKKRTKPRDPTYHLVDETAFLEVRAALMEIMPHLRSMPDWIPQALDWGRAYDSSNRPNNQRAAMLKAIRHSMIGWIPRNQPPLMEAAMRSIADRCERAL